MIRRATFSSKHQQTVGAFRAEPAGYAERYNAARLKAFWEGGRAASETIDGRRAGLGLAT